MALAGLALAALVAGGIAALRLEPPAKAQGDAAAAPVPVLAEPVEARDMDVTVREVGTIQPLASVAVRPRVDGQIVEVGFTEGDWVEAGSVLFRLDDRTARAELAQAQAQLAQDRARLPEARRTVERNAALATRGNVAQATLDTARTNVATLEAAIAAGEARIQGLETALDLTVIRAPIAGRTGAVAAKLGTNVRAADATALVTINQTRPIQVAFSVPQRELAAVRASAARGPVPVTVTVKGSLPVTADGALAFIDNAIERTSGTIELKATLPNTDERLWPGAFVDVVLHLETRPGVPAVPAQAILVGQDGPYAYVVGPDKTVTVRPVTIERTIEGVSYLASGLAPGEIVVTDGQMRLVGGARVVVRDPAAPQG
jgi:multidrug efflux system membrane fusion protein